MTLLHSQGYFYSMYDFNVFAKSRLNAFSNMMLGIERIYEFSIEEIFKGCRCLNACLSGCEKCGSFGARGSVNRCSAWIHGSGREKLFCYMRVEIEPPNALLLQLNLRSLLSQEYQAGSIGVKLTKPLAQVMASARGTMSRIWVLHSTLTHLSRRPGLGLQVCCLPLSLHPIPLTSKVGQIENMSKIELRWCHFQWLPAVSLILLSAHISHVT